MTTMQLALIAGALVGMGLAAGVLAFAPTHPALGDFLAHLNPATRVRIAAQPEITSASDRVGVWLMRRLPLTRWLKPPVKELDLLQMPLHRFYARKAIYAGIGLVFPLLFGAGAVLLRIPIPFAIPVAASVAAAIGLSFLPDMEIRSQADQARTEFQHALTAYIDLVAIARNSGAQTRQAMEQAAATGDSWAFARIQEALYDSNLSHRNAWEALRTLAERLDVPGLDDLADIMRLSAEDNAAVYQILRAKASAMRNTMMNDDLAKANAATNQISYPEATLPMLLVVLLGVPVVLSLMGG